MELVTSIVSVIDNEIKRFDPFETRINELKESYSGLTIKGVEDREGYEAVRKAVADLRTIRTGTEKDKALVKAPFLAACNSIEEKVKFIISSVKAVEEPLKKMLDEVDAEKEKIKAEKNRKKDEQYARRLSQLSGLGAILIEGHIVKGALRYDIVVLRGMPEEVYLEDVLPEYKALWQQEENERLALEEKRKEEEEKLKKEREEFEQKRTAFWQEKDLFEAKQRALREEKARQEQIDRNNILSKRKQQLLNLGMKHDVGEYRFESLSVFKSTIIEANEEEWEILITHITPRIEAIKKQMEEKLLKDQQAHDESIRQQTLREAEDKAKAEEARKEEERVTATDKEKWQMFLSSLQMDQERFIFRSGQYRKKMQIAKEKIEEIQNL